MKRKPVQSSSISSIGYDNESQILEIEFKNGSLYHYFDIPQSIFDQLMNASSHGTYLNRTIKGSYNYRRIY